MNLMRGEEEAEGRSVGRSINGGRTGTNGFRCGIQSSNGGKDEDEDDGEEGERERERKRKGIYWPGELNQSIKAHGIS